MPEPKPTPVAERFVDEDGVNDGPPCFLCGHDEDDHVNSPEEPYKADGQGCWGGVPVPSGVTYAGVDEMVAERCYCQSFLSVEDPILKVPPTEFIEAIKTAEWQRTDRPRRLFVDEVRIVDQHAFVSRANLLALVAYVEAHPEPQPVQPPFPAHHLSCVKWTEDGRQKPCTCPSYWRKTP